MGKTRKDLFEMWNETGKWPEVRDFLFDCFSKLVTQKEICERLQMDEATFIKLKRKHPEIERLKQDARLDLKRNLVGAMIDVGRGKDDIDVVKERLESKNKINGYTAPACGLYLDKIEY